jgi:molybdopterin molybdotransferase
MLKPPHSEITQTQAHEQSKGLPVATVQSLIQQYLVPLQESETVALTDALNRVLATDIISPIHVPAHDNAAMDGYALRSADLANSINTKYQVVGLAVAGKKFTGTVQTNECIRIMTGAQMPDECDTVIPQELITLHKQESEETISFASKLITAGANRRLKGEDLAKDKPALLAGKLLSPADLGLIASLGIAKVSVKRKLRVAIFSTGDELRSLGEALPEGCVYDSNRYTLQGMLQKMGVTPIDLGVVKDDPIALEATLREACSQADVILTSGGVSGGDADYTRSLMAKLGDVLFWKIAMRPGRPMAFGKITSGEHNAILFGLPGNPVAVMVTFYFFVRPALYQLSGRSKTDIHPMQVTSAHAIRKKSGRTEYQRGILFFDEHGKQQVRITGSQGSGILSSMSEANCMVILQHNQGDIAAGASVEVIPFEGLL